MSTGNSEDCESGHVATGAATDKDRFDTPNFLRVLQSELAHATSKHKPVSHFGTLDNVPEFAMRSVGQLYSVIFSRFENYTGVNVYGPRSGCWPDNGYWGRSMTLFTQEILQIRFWPPTLLSDTETHFPMIRIATRITLPVGDRAVAVFTGFSPSVFCNERAELNVDVIETMPRIVGCRGLHVLMASLFKRHSGARAMDFASTVRGNYDRFGYESLRSTTFSVHSVDRKQLERTADHSSACAASPGTSVLMIAGELVDVHLEPTGGRVAQPISQKRWKDTGSMIKNEILQNPRGADAGLQAITSASCIVDLLSAEGIVGMLAGGFYKGALPDRVVGPHGVPLLLAMAVRLATHWKAYRLPRPSQADLYANDQLRMIYESSGYGPLPALEGAHWCIDVVVRGALDAAIPEVEELKRQRGLPATAKLAVIEDSKCFWQRVGQRLITAFFGLGAVCPRSSHGSHGSAWRVSDPLQLARDRFLVTQGVNFEGVSEPILPAPASFGERKAMFVTMLTDVERFLRNGHHVGMELTPRHSPQEIEMHMENIRCVLKKMMADQMVHDLVSKLSVSSPNTNTKPYDQTVADSMVGNFHLPSMGAAITDCTEALLHGPAVHFKYVCGAYVVAPTQTAPCSDCLAPVHVLQGTMLGNTYSECTACHAKRCIPCTEAYVRAVRVTASQKVGKSCRICGAEPAFVTVKKHIDARGEELMQIHLGERTPVEVNSSGPISASPVRTQCRDCKTGKSGKKKRGGKPVEGSVG